MPHDPLQIHATWIPPVPGAAHWLLEYDIPLLGSIGATDPTRWSVWNVVGVVPTVANVLANGCVQLINPAYTGAELSVRYIGHPPQLSTLAGGVLAAYDHVIPH